MLLIPAIDLKEGKCVRLRQGRMDDSTVFSDDPVAMAVHWAQLGCRRLHIVDLDGAFAGEPKNRALIQNMVQSIPEVPVQVGGGIRSMEIIESYLAAGVLLLIAAQFNQVKFGGFEAVRGPIISSGQGRQLEEIKGTLEKIRSDLAATADGTTKED